MTWFLIAVIVCCTVASDVLQSFEMKRSGSAGDVSRSLRALTRPLFMLSIALLAIAFFAFLRVLRLAPISFIAPVTAITYVLDGVSAKYLLKEHVNNKRWLGIAFVFAGVILISTR